MLIILQRLQSIVVNYQKGLFKVNFTLVMWSMGGMGDDVSGGCKKGPKPPVPCQHTHHTTLYPTLHTHQTVPLCIYTIPFHTACPAQCTPCSGLPVTNRTRQATNITIEDRWHGVQRNTHKIPHCGRGEERKRICVQRRTCPPPRRGSCPDLPRPLNAPNSSRINHNTAQL